MSIKHDFTIFLSVKVYSRTCISNPLGGFSFKEVSVGKREWFFGTSPSPRVNDFGELWIDPDINYEASIRRWSITVLPATAASTFDLTGSA